MLHLRRLTLVPALALLIATGGCATTSAPGTDTADIGQYCKQKPYVCVLVGGVVAGGVVGIAMASHHDTATPPPVPSDARLKTDIRPVETLADGIRLYAYRYQGGSETFVGVLAQDLLADPRFVDAVVKTPGGYYAVDYARLGLQLVNGDAMRAAGELALASAG